MKREEVGKCCGRESSAHEHPDYKKELNRINRISGQLEGVSRMILGREYCPKIITQIQAIRAALKSLESVILEKHLEMCVTEAFSSRDKKAAEAKLNELIELFRKN